MFLFFVLFTKKIFKMRSEIKLKSRFSDFEKKVVLILILKRYYYDFFVCVVFMFERKLGMNWPGKLFFSIF